MDLTIWALVVAVAVIGVTLFLVSRLSLPAQGLNKQKYQSNWLAIEQKLQPGDIDSQHMAIINADKLLDQALKEVGAKGETMAERLKSKQPIWTNINTVWAAHKLRNQIAHDEKVQVSEDTIRRALASFKKALRDLGAI